MCVRYLPAGKLIITAAFAPTVLGLVAFIESVIRCSPNSSGGIFDDVRRIMGPSSFIWNKL